MSRQRSRAERAEQGAIALMAAMLCVVLFAVAAIAVDLGMAYVSKRQLQTAADAGVLAATQVYKDQSDSCATLLTNSTLRQQAQEAADKWAEANRPGKVGTPIELSCPAGGGISVRYSVSGDTGTSFTGIFNGPSSISTARTAGANIGSVVNVGGLRPWGICSQVVNTSGNVIFVPMLGGSTATGGPQVCGNQNPPGGWWVATCNGQSNANGATALAVLNGCAQTYAAVPNQQASWNSNQLYNHLVGYCPSGSANSTCLKQDQGNNFHNSTDSWQTLVGQTIQMPVFCVRTKCSTMAVAGNGNNAAYAIQQIATVELCGFKLNPRGASSGWPTTGACATRNPSSYTSNSVTGNGAGFFLVIKALSGGTTPLAAARVQGLEAHRSSCASPRRWPIVGLEPHFRVQRSRPVDF